VVAAPARSLVNLFILVSLRRCPSARQGALLSLAFLLHPVRQRDRGDDPGLSHAL
jgi:hypothetical protein